MSDSGTSGPGPAIREFGDYLIVGEIASGGMGVVYDARQISFNHRVALKLIRSGQMATQAEVRRFQTEAEAVGRLDHPNIVPIYEVGQHGGQHFVSMKLIDGESLAQRMSNDECRMTKKGRKPPGVSLSPGEEGRREGGPSPDFKFDIRHSTFVMAKVARAVHHAHQRGVLHRDLKPANILLDEQGEPHLIDFGLAKLLERTTGQTLSLAVLGTPAYMAPELAAGGSKHATTASDIYSLGAILYELLTGRPPFVGDTPGQILEQVRHDEPKPPRALDPRADLDLQTICLKCLDKTPSRRYATAEALANELERWQRGEPIHARPASEWERLVKWARRKPALAGMAAALVVIGVLGFGGVAWQAQLTRAANRRLAEQVTRLELRSVDSLLANNQSAQALALLARVLRREPENPVAAARILATLTTRPFALPAAPPMRHTGAVHFAHFSPDGERVLTASQEHAAHLWNARSGQPMGEPMRHDGEVFRAIFSPDGQRVATASADGTARVWDGHKGLPLTPPLRHSNEVLFVDFSPDGLRVATASRDQTARIWDARTGQPLREPYPNEGAALCIRFSPDASRVVVTSADGGIRVWGTGAGGWLLSNSLPHRVRSEFLSWDACFSPKGDLLAHSGPGMNSRPDLFEMPSFEHHVELAHNDRIHTVAFSPDGRRLLTASEDRSARLWDTATNRLLATLPHYDGVKSAVFSSDGTLIVTASADGTAKIWDAQMGRALLAPLPHDASVYYAEFSPDARRVVTASADGVAQIWDIPAPSTAAARLLRQEPPVEVAQFSPNGRLAASYAQQILNGTNAVKRAARIWDVETGKVLGPSVTNEHWVCCVRFSPDSANLLAASIDGRVFIRDVHTGAQVTVLGNEDDAAILDAQFSPDGGRIAGFAGERWVRVLDLRRGESANRYLTNGATVTAVRFSPDGKHLAVAGHDFTATLWDVQTGKIVATTPAHAGWVRQVEFSRDGRLGVSCGTDQFALVWDAHTGRRISPPLRHSASVAMARFSPDGHSVLTASADGNARLWNIRTGSPLVEPMAHDAPVLLARFSPDGQWVLTAARDHAVRIWDALTGLPLTEAQRVHTGEILGGEFSPDGRRAMTFALDGMVCLWDVPGTSLPVPAWLPDLAEAVAGQRLDTAGRATTIAPTNVWKLRGELLARTDADVPTRLAKAFLAGRNPSGPVPGSSGHWPVPSGDPPGGTGGAFSTNKGRAFFVGADPIPVGGSPTGAGESPAPPIPEAIHLPVAAAVGKVLHISSQSPGGWRLLQNPGQFIFTSGWVWTPCGPTKHWSSIACSADGMTLAAIVRNGEPIVGKDYIYVSTDGGATWTPRESKRFWTDVAMSADGRRVVAVTGATAYTPGRIYLSTDGGVTWTPRERNRRWRAVAMSADGMKLAATTGDSDSVGRLYTSSDGGVTWTPRELDRNWGPIAMSADGSRLAAGITGYTGGFLYTSGDGGVTWTAHMTGRNKNWASVAMSPDGRKLVAVERAVPHFGADARILISADFGVTWTACPNKRCWVSAAISADESQLLAVETGADAAHPEHGQIHHSRDFGLTWTAVGPKGWWHPLASSADGNRLIAGQTSEGRQGYSGYLAGGRIYISTPSTAPGPASSLLGAPGAEMELEYIGNHQFRILKATGAIANAGVNSEAKPPR